MQTTEQKLDCMDSIALESFAAEASDTAENLERYGGSTVFYGNRFTFRDAPRLRKVSQDIGRYLAGDGTEHQRMLRILAMIRRQPCPGAPSPRPGHGVKTYVVNRAVRYRIALYLNHLDDVRRQMEKGMIESACELGTTYTDAADFGDFVNSVRRLHDKTDRHSVPGTEYGFAIQCSEEGTKYEGKSN